MREFSLIAFFPLNQFAHLERHTLLINGTSIFVANFDHYFVTTFEIEILTVCPYMSGLIRICPRMQA